MATDYSFLKEPLTGSTHGFDPAVRSDLQWNKTLLNATFGEWDSPLDDGPSLSTQDEEDGDLDTLHGIHDLTLKTYRDVIETIERVRQDEDPSLNSDGRLKIVANIVEPKLATLAGMAEREVANVAKAVDEVEGKITQATRVMDPVDAQVHHSVREYLKGLGDSQFPGAVQRAILERDKVTLQAIATAPGYLSGFGHGQASQALYARVQATLAEIVAPDLVNRRDKLRKGMAVTAKALSALDAKVKRTIDFNKAAALRAKSKSYG